VWLWRRGCGLAQQAQRERERNCCSSDTTLNARSLDYKAGRQYPQEIDDLPTTSAGRNQRHICVGSTTTHEGARTEHHSSRYAGDYRIASSPSRPDQKAGFNTMRTRSRTRPATSDRQFVYQARIRFRRAGAVPKAAD